jgi:hypothetical protein
MFPTKFKRNVCIPWKKPTASRYRVEYWPGGKVQRTPGESACLAVADPYDKTSPHYDPQLVPGAYESPPTYGKTSPHYDPKVVPGAYDSPPTYGKTSPHYDPPQLTPGVYESPPTYGKTSPHYDPLTPGVYESPPTYYVGTSGKYAPTYHEPAPSPPAYPSGSSQHHGGFAPPYSTIVAPSHEDHLYL